MGSIWVIVNMNGELCASDGCFPSRKTCQGHINERADHTEFTPVEVKATEQSDYWVLINRVGTLFGEAGFFASQVDATERINTVLDPPDKREQGRPAALLAMPVWLTRAAATNADKNSQ